MKLLFWIQKIQNKLFLNYLKESMYVMLHNFCMIDLMEHRICVKFCYKFGNMTETPNILILEYRYVTIKQKLLIMILIVFT